MVKQSATILKNHRLVNAPTHVIDRTLADYGDLLSVADLSTLFEVSKQTIYREIRNGKFGEPIRIGRAYKIPKIYLLEKYFYST